LIALLYLADFVAAYLNAYYYKALRTRKTIGTYGRYSGAIMPWAERKFKRSTASQTLEVLVKCTGRNFVSG
jgi:hypothetical protein